MKELDSYIERYSAAGTAAENDLLEELERVTNLRVVQPKMVSGRVQGAFLRLVVEMIRPRRVLEIGTFTGYSALAMAAALGEERDQWGRSPELHTIEVDDELEDTAREFFARSVHGRKIHLHIGSALDIMPSLAREGGPFDLVFVDGDKREYPSYYDMLFSEGLVASGSIILVDNVLWYGKVADGVSLDRHTEAIREFNAMVATDERVENVILPLRDGVNLIRVK